MVRFESVATRDIAGDGARSPTTPQSMEVIEAVATRSGVAPVDLPERLYDVIDPDALDGLLTLPNSDAGRPISVEFTYCGYHITVNSDGRIALDSVGKACRS